MLGRFVPNNLTPKDLFIQDGISAGSGKGTCCPGGGRARGLLMHVGVKAVTTILLIVFLTAMSALYQRGKSPSLLL